MCAPDTRSTLVKFGQVRREEEKKGVESWVKSGREGDRFVSPVASAGSCHARLKPSTDIPVGRLLKCLYSISPW